ncbi:MAG TPA: DUF167 domain-containing protein [Candidatus Nanoarchaeia archaeon]|nr:DUF167 domain-containing protein [Candidatus Nanoarchaeia archaeon]
MILEVKVRPNSKVEKIDKISDKGYKINVKEPAENNKANIRVINLLSKELGVDFRKIRIKNPASRNKIIEISD